VVLDTLKKIGYWVIGLLIVGGFFLRLFEGPSDYLDAPELLVGHLGEAHGVLSSALLDPQTGNGIVIIITGTADDPANHPGHSPLYRVEESVITWWLDQLNDGTANLDP
tara:strand:- start:539 stop:865 length:327 start_codon:yes stop_codon:yes gene_type:complete